MSLCVLHIAMCKHFVSSLKINALDSIFRLIHIPNVPMLIILIPPYLLFMLFVDYGHLFVDCVNSSIDYDNTSANYTNKYDDYVNTPDDLANTSANLAYTLNISFLDL